MATKAELLEQAQALGIETVNENSTVADIKAAIAAISNPGTGTGPGNPPEAPKNNSVEEWYCRITDTGNGMSVEKLKKQRDRVLISDEQAAVLNDGRIHGGNAHAYLYFAAGADAPVTID